MNYMRMKSGVATPVGWGKTLDKLGVTSFSKMDALGPPGSFIIRFEKDGETLTVRRAEKREKTTFLGKLTAGQQEIAKHVMAAGVGELIVGRENVARPIPGDTHAEIEELDARLSEIRDGLPAIAQSGTPHFDALATAFSEAKTALRVISFATPKQTAEFVKNALDKFAVLETAYQQAKPSALEGVFPSVRDGTNRFVRCEESNLGLLESLGAQVAAYDHDKGGVTVRVTATLLEKIGQFPADFTVESVTTAGYSQAPALDEPGHGALMGELVWALKRRMGIDAATSWTKAERSRSIEAWQAKSSEIVRQAEALLGQSRVAVRGTAQSAASLEA